MFIFSVEVFKLISYTDYSKGPDSCTLLKAYSPS